MTNQNIKTIQNNSYKHFLRQLARAFAVMINLMKHVSSKYLDQEYVRSLDNAVG